MQPIQHLVWFMTDFELSIMSAIEMSIVCLWI